MGELILGDSLEVLKTIPDESVDLVLTDPPYNISTKNKIFRDYRSGNNGDISMDFGEWDYEFNPTPFLEETKRILKPHGQWLIFSSEQLYGKYRDWFNDNAYFKQLLVWQKTNPLPEFRLVKYRQTTELICWSLKTKLPKAQLHFNFLEQNEMKNIFTGPICAGKERLKHPTQKPLWLIRKLIARHTRPGDIVLDPFMGVGTIPHACKEIGLDYIGIDINEEYYNKANQRLNMIQEGIF